MIKNIVNIGLEIHCQLITNTKLFSNCIADENTQPNKNIDYYTLGYPGTLPLLNKKVVEYALKASVALNSKINNISRFDRKNYFYHDLPKNYQITQNEIPLAINGYLLLPNNKKINIHRIHIEEDAGKSIYKNDELLIDYNRAGIALIEIVTFPEIQNGNDAAIFVKEIKNIMKILGINSGDLQKGAIRCDANISLQNNDGGLGNKVEVKNLNSFKYIKDAIEFEIKRQMKCKSNNIPIIKETRTYDEKLKETIPIRTKEDDKDYMYLPEPDIPDLVIKDDDIEKIKDAIPKLPAYIRKKLQEKYNIKKSNIEIFIEYPEFLEYFYKVNNSYYFENQQLINSIFITAVYQYYNKYNDFPSHEILYSIYKGINENQIPKSAIKIILDKAKSDKLNYTEIIENHNLKLMNTENELLNYCETSINENPKTYDKYINGRKNLIGFFIGDVIKRTKGRADPIKTKEILMKLLENN